MLEIVQIHPIGFQVNKGEKELTREHTFKAALSFVLGYLLQDQTLSQFTVTITNNSSQLWDDLPVNFEAMDRGAYFQ